MEILVLLFICVGASVAAKGKARAHRRRLPPKYHPAHRPARQTSSPKQRQTFDPETARPVPRHKALRGAAWVVDGDTIRVCKTQIRLFGIDAPELNHPYGKAAKWAMVRLCKGQSIRVEVLECDVHGRTVGKCYLPDGRDLSAELVKQGLAIDWPKYSGGVYLQYEVPGVRKKLWLADARQKGRMHVWDQFEARQRSG